MANYQDFEKLEIRVGKIIEINDFPEAHHPSYQLKIDFGDFIGEKKSAAQLVDHYPKEKLLGKLVLAVVNFPPKQIGPFQSEVLTLGVPDEEEKCVLVVPDKKVPLGGRLY